MSQSVSQLSATLVLNCTRWRFGSEAKRASSRINVLGPSGRHDADVLRSCSSNVAVIRDSWSGYVRSFG